MKQSYIALGILDQSNADPNANKKLMQNTKRSSLLMSVKACLSFLNRASQNAKMHAYLILKALDHSLTVMNEVDK